MEDAQILHQHPDRALGHPNHRQTPIQDEADRLETVTTPRGAVGYGYWPDGLRKATGLPNGLSEGRCYDKAGQLTAIVTRAGAVADTCPDTGEDRSRFRYAYDGNGNRQSQQEWRTDPGTQVLGAVEETTYGYDGLDRLVGVQYPGGKAELYRLDAVGNRTGERELAGVSLSGAQLVSYEPPAGATVVRDVTSTFNRADWLVSLADQKDPTRDVTLGWTASGELLTKTTATVSRSLTWDGRGALVAVTDNGTEVGRYDYDADGLRVKRKTATENVEYVLDEAHVLQEADAAIQEHPSYRRYHYGAEPVLVVDGGTGRFIGTDALGSPTDLTSTTGRVEAKRQYDAWGKYRNGTAPGAGEAKLGFTGHQFDPETGLIYARARYYDPEIGRFISRDTYEGEIEDAPSLHRFTYAHGNPLKYGDPSGEGVVDFLKGALKGAAVAAGVAALIALAPLTIPLSVAVTLAVGGTVLAGLEVATAQQEFKAGMISEEARDERFGNVAGSFVGGFGGPKLAGGLKAAARQGSALVSEAAAGLESMVPQPAFAAAGVRSSGRAIAATVATSDAAVATGGQMVSLAAAGNHGQRVVSEMVNRSESGGAKPERQTVRESPEGPGSQPAAEPPAGKPPPQARPAEQPRDAQGRFQSRNPGDARPGEPFEQRLEKVVREISDPDSVSPQVRIRTAEGETTIPDVGSRFHGRVKLTEGKGSNTARLNSNQADAYPQIEQSGGVVTGTGTSQFPAGAQIPPTRVRVIRPEHLERLQRLRNVRDKQKP